MICERCRGKRYVYTTHPEIVGEVLAPCPECNGCGQESCCQGHESQPEPEADE